MTFQRPVIATTVIIYLASDGIHGVDLQQSNTLSVNIIDVYSVSHPMTSPDEIVVSCRGSPLHLNVLHDLSRPLFKTTGTNLISTSSVQDENISFKLKACTKKKQTTACCREGVEQSRTYSFSHVGLYRCLYSAGVP